MELPSSIVSDPPRDIPLSTKLVVLFGGTFSWFGWFLAGFGMIFVILFASQADFSSWIYFRGALETSPAIVTASEETHASEGGGKHRRGTPIYEHHFKFSFGGAEYAGTSYCTGGGLRDNQHVTVEFPAGKPDLSRIQGMRRAMFGPFVIFVFIFPLIGLTLVAVTLRTGKKNIFLLANGESAQARNTGKEPTHTRVNNRTVYKVWFEFTDRSGGLQKTSTRTSTPEKLEGRAFEPLFYDVNNPVRCAFLHNLPGSVALDERGGVKPCGAGQVFSALWAPVLAAIFVIAGALLHRLL